MPIYLKFGSILGDVQDAGHENWIQLASIGWNAVRPVSSPSGTTAARVLSAPRLGELTFSKDQDVASIPLIQQSLEGQPQDATIEFVRTGSSGADAEVYYSIALKQAVITAFSQSGGAGDRPMESLTFNFTQVSFKGTQMDSDGSGTSPTSYGWNVLQNTAV